MVLCIIALPIFAILGIFSVKYRKLTKDSLECLFKTVTFRKCESGLDDRIKSDITGRAMKVSPKTGKFFYKNYKIISWIILILFVWSLYASGIGIYNYVQYGNCNGPASTGFCVFDPTGSNSKITEVNLDYSGEFVLPILEDNDPIIGDPDAELTIIEFGCFKCPYTKKAEAIVKEVLDYYEGKVNLQFKTFLIPDRNFSYESAIASSCAQEQGKYKDFHDIAFRVQDILNNETLFDVMERINLNMTQFKTCYENQTYKKEVDADIEMGVKAHIKGTPTFFINDKVIVGPKPFKTFKSIIDDELEKN